MGDENNSAIGFGIHIDDAVFTQITNLENKIKGLEETSRNTADKINKSFLSIGKIGVQDLINNLTKAQGAINGLSGVNPMNFSGFSQAMVEASNAVNRMGNANLSSLTGQISNLEAIVKKIRDKGLLDEEEEKLVLKSLTNDLKVLSNEQARVSRELSLANQQNVLETKENKEKAKVQSQEYINALQKELNALDKENARLKANSSTWKNYSKAMLMSEQTVLGRTKKIERLKSVMHDMQKDTKTYANEISLIEDKMAQLDKENTKVVKSTDKVRGSQNQLMKTSMQLRRALGLLFSISQIKNYIAKIVNVRGEFELQNKALQAILQNKQEANQLFDQITQLAVKSPFQLKELVTYTKQLAAYRVESDKLYDTTKMLADVSAGLGVSMDRLILAYGQVKAANYLRGTELRQFSEAGINVLGELATYFTELEGRAVSVGDVFERVSNRMVKFSDVEEIFKRLTQEGGIFFQMQEIQAETVTGMLSNMKDSLDIMVNEIGKDWEGTIKNGLSMVKYMIDNYQIFSVILKGVTMGFVAYAAKAALAARTNFILSKSMDSVSQSALKMRMEQGIGINVFSKGISKYKSLLAGLKGNVWSIIAAAIATATFALFEWNKKVEKAKAKYDELSHSLVDSRLKLNGMIDSLKEQNHIIKENEASLSTLEKGTSEYEKTSNRLNEAELKKNKILSKLSSEYPDLYNAYMQNKDGLDILIEKQRLYNDELDRTLALNIAMSDEESWFNEGLEKDLTDYAEAQKKYNIELRNAKARYPSIEAEVMRLIQTNKQFSREQEKFTKILNSNRSEFEKTADLYKEINDKGYADSRKLFDLLEKSMASVVPNQKKYNSALEEANKELQKMITTALNGQDYKNLQEDEQEKIQNILKRYAESLGILKDEVARDLFNQKVKAELGVEIDFSKVTEAASYTIQQIQDYLIKHPIKMTSTLQKDSDPKDFFESVRKEVESNEVSIEKLTNAAVQLNKDISNQDARNELVARNNAMVALLKTFGEWENKTSNNTDAEKSAVEQLKKRIALLKEMVKTYKKYRQYYDEADADKKVRKDFQDSVEDEGLSDIVSTMTFDTSGLIDGINRMVASLNEEMQKIGNKEVDHIKSEIDLVVSKETFEALKQEVNDIFSNFDISSQIKEIGLGKELADIFGVDFVDSLDDLKIKLSSLVEPIKGSEEGAKLFEDIQIRIKDKEQENFKERLSNLQQFLAHTVDEIEAVQNSGALDIKFATDLLEQGVLETDEYMQTLQNIVVGVNDEISRINVEKFKDSPEYIKAMGDLSMYSRGELKKLLSTLENLIAESAGALDPSDLKVYYDAIDKTRDALDKVENPFDKNFIAQVIKLKNLQQEYNEETERYNELLEQQARDKEALAQAERDLEIAKQQQKVQGKNWANDIGMKMAENNAQTATANLQKTNGALAQSGSKLSSISGAIGKIAGGASGALGMVDMIIKGVYKAIKATVEMFYEVKDLMDTFGKETDEGGWTDAKIAFDALGEMNENVMGAWEALKSGDGLGADFKIKAAMFSIIKGVNRLIDNQNEKQIQEQLKRIKKLEKAYKDLGYKIDEALTLKSTTVAYENAIENLNTTLNTYKSILALEEDKKDTDKKEVEEYKDEIKELEREKNKINAQRLDFFGGFGDAEAMRGAADEFTSTWLDAYEETGDGLDALNDKWDEYIKNVVAKQMMLKGLEIYMKGIMDDLNFMLRDNVFDSEEANDLRAKIDEVMPQLNEFWKGIAESYGLATNAAQEGLSDLQKGIQGITETTAQAIEGYLNSMRFFVSDSNLAIRKVVNILSGIDGYPNPMLNELRNQTRVMTNIYDVLFSIVKGGHPLGGSGLKTFMS